MAKVNNLFYYACCISENIILVRDTCTIPQFSICITISFHKPMLYISYLIGKTSIFYKILLVICLVSSVIINIIYYNNFIEFFQIVKYPILNCVTM